MDHSFYFAAGINLLINLIYAVLALCAGVGGFRAIDRYLFRDIEFIDEIKRGNMAAAVFASALLLFTALVIGLVLRS